MKSLCLILITAVASFGQTYPRWFLEPVSLDCGAVAAGFSVPYFHEASSDSMAFVNACENLSRRHYMELTGGEAYWATEAGVYWMGNDFAERTDSSYLKYLVKNGERLDSCSSAKMTVLLVADEGCDMPDSMRALVACPETEPDWVEDMPQSNTFVYAEGVSPMYFYEPDSWETAEKRALFNLARSIKVSMEELQKMNGASGQEIMNEEITVSLRNVAVVYRWYDGRRGLCYVLVRMPTAQGGAGDKVQ